MVPILSLRIAGMRLPLLLDFMCSQPSARLLTPHILRLVHYSSDGKKEVSSATIQTGYGRDFDDLIEIMKQYDPTWYVARDHADLRWEQTRIPWTAAGVRWAFFHTLRQEYIRRIPPPWDVEKAS